MTCTQTFWNFFKEQAEAVPGVATVNRSGGDKMDRLLASSRSENLYPACFLTRPKYSVADNGAGATIAWFDAMFYLICESDMGNDEAEDAAFDEAEQMATVLWAMIRNQQDDYKVYIEPDTKIYLEPVTMIGIDAALGYEVKIRVGLLVNQEVYG